MDSDQLEDRYGEAPEEHPQDAHYLPRKRKRGGKAVRLKMMAREAAQNERPMMLDDYDDFDAPEDEDHPRQASKGETWLEDRYADRYSEQRSAGGRGRGRGRGRGDSRGRMPSREAGWGSRGDDEPPMRQWGSAAGDGSQTGTSAQGPGRDGAENGARTASLNAIDVDADAKPSSPSSQQLSASAVTTSPNVAQSGPSAGPSSAREPLPPQSDIMPDSVRGRARSPPGRDERRQRRPSPSYQPRAASPDYSYGAAPRGRGGGGRRMSREEQPYGRGRSPDAGAGRGRQASPPRRQWGAPRAQSPPRRPRSPPRGPMQDRRRSASPPSRPRPPVRDRTPPRGPAEPVRPTTGAFAESRGPPQPPPQRSQSFVAIGAFAGPPAGPSGGGPGSFMRESYSRPQAPPEMSPSMMSVASAREAFPPQTPVMQSPGLATLSRSTSYPMQPAVRAIPPPPALLPDVVSEIASLRAHRQSTLLRESIAANIASRRALHELSLREADARFHKENTRLAEQQIERFTQAAAPAMLASGSFGAS